MSQKSLKSVLQEPSPGSYSLYRTMKAGKKHTQPVYIKWIYIYIFGFLKEVKSSNRHYFSPRTTWVSYVDTGVIASASEILQSV